MAGLWGANKILLFRENDQYKEKIIDYLAAMLRAVILLLFAQPSEDSQEEGSAKLTPWICVPQIR